MQDSSTDFYSAAIATVRKPKAKIDIIWTTQEDDDTATITSNDINFVDKTNQVNNKVGSMKRLWAHLDGVIKADGTRYAMPGPDNDTAEAGWYGATRCDGSNVWPGDDPWIQLEFLERPIVGVFVVGDDKYQEYPVDFDIEFYAGALLKHTEVVTDNDQLAWTKILIQENLFDITKMILTIKKWSHPNRIVKIAEFTTGFVQTIDGDTLVSMNILEERTISDGSLPVGNISANEIDVVLQNVRINGEIVGEVIDPFFPDNPDSVYQNLVKPNKILRPYIGFETDNGIEYVKMGKFWTGDWRINEQDFTCSVSARDRMERLRQFEFKGSDMYINTSYREILQAILLDAQTNIPMGDLDWYISTELSNYTVPYGWVDRMSYFKAIKMIVEACMGQAYMNRDDVLIIEGPTALTV